MAQKWHKNLSHDQGIFVAEFYENLSTDEWGHMLDCSAIIRGHEKRTYNDDPEIVFRNQQ